MITQLFNEIVFKPILNLLIFVYQYVGDFGITIIFITIILKLILFPLTRKSYESQRALAKIQPHLRELQEKYKNNKEKLALETMNLYRQLNVKPFGFFIPFIIQIVVLIALYRVILISVQNGFQNFLYSFTPSANKISLLFLGSLDLSKPNIIIAFLAAVSQFFSSYLVMKRNQLKHDQQKSENRNANLTSDFAQNFNKQLIFFMPAITFMVGLQLPSALVFYWFISTILGILEIQLLYNIFLKDKA